MMMNIRVRVQAPDSKSKKVQRLFSVNFGLIFAGPRLISIHQPMKFHLPINLLPRFMSPFLFLLASMAFLFTSCADETEDPSADPRDKFEGAWLCNESGPSGSSTFTIYITPYGPEDSIRISNFAGYGNTAVAAGVVAGNSLTIPYHRIGITNIPVQGSGVYSSQGGNEKITMNYMADSVSYTAVCTR